MTDPTAELTGHTPKHNFLVCIDSDGCAFDSMEIKHKECFIPQIIKFWGLQPVSKYARDAAEFINLYSQWRGVNRFPALALTLDLLNDWPAVQARGSKIPKISNLRNWIDTESKLGNPALEAYVAAHPEEKDMVKALAWSKEVNAIIADMVHDVPPFPLVRECLELANTKADCFVCSGTPQATLEEEWRNNDIRKYVFTIAGQEQGKKAEHIAMANQDRYDVDNILMIGDAPGDMKAARANNAHFFPIIPGEEETSWEKLHAEGLPRFFANEYDKTYETALVEAFNAKLPDTPPWKK